MEMKVVGFDGNEILEEDQTYYEYVLSSNKFVVHKRAIIC